MPKRAKKKAEPVTGGETTTPRREPDEPELKATTEAGLDRQGESHIEGKGATPNESEAEAKAEAADTFEQAYEDRLPPDRRTPFPLEACPPEPIETAGEIPAIDREAKEEPAEFPPAVRPPAHLERLQKILSQAGVASRRHAEEMITQGRVQVNGKVVMELGSKADPERDHIRVDGKLLHGAERLRYFVLNKPKGYVTTVSDPEGRPTVMQFFKKMNERLYPVGRLDYQSEGLLLVTNDGDLANKLTRAASGVEKTYLVKVSGQPGEEELDRLRSGLAIDRGRPGEGRVETGRAAIQQVRSGDNPWYEVVLTEGRNRELRKMFEEIGHHVEKIRRVGYGPLVLDLEPGRFRELEPEEVARLRLAADGKWRKPKPKEREPRGQEFRRRGQEKQKHAPVRNTRERGQERGREWKPERRGERGAGPGPAFRDATSARPGRPGPGGPKRKPERKFETGANRDRSRREVWHHEDRTGSRERRTERPKFDSGRADARGFQGGRSRSAPLGSATDARRPAGARPERPYSGEGQGRRAPGGGTRLPSKGPLNRRRESPQAAKNRPRDRRGKGP